MRSLPHPPHPQFHPLHNHHDLTPPCLTTPSKPPAQDPANAPKPPTAALESLSLEEKETGADGSAAPKKSQPENTFEGEHHVDVD